MINLDWDKVNGLIPAIIQDHETLEILMLGYMNERSIKNFSIIWICYLL